jgi:hypothetical protein
MTGLELVCLVVAVFSWGWLLVDRWQEIDGWTDEVGPPPFEARCVRLLPADPKLYDWETADEGGVR